MARRGDVEYSRGQDKVSIIGCRDVHGNTVLWDVRCEGELPFELALGN